MTAISAGSASGLRRRPVRHAEERRREIDRRRWLRRHDWYSGVGGAALDLFGFKVAGSVGIDNLGDIQHKFMTAGVAYGFARSTPRSPTPISGNSNNDFETQAGYKKPGNLVLSADYAIAPGLVLASDLAGFDMDQTNAGKAATVKATRAGWRGKRSAKSSNLSRLALRDFECGGA